MAARTPKSQETAVAMAIKGVFPSHLLIKESERKNCDPPPPLFCAFLFLLPLLTNLPGINADEESIK